MIIVASLNCVPVGVKKLNSEQNNQSQYTSITQENFRITFSDVYEIESTNRYTRLVRDSLYIQIPRDQKEYHLSELSPALGQSNDFDTLRLVYNTKLKDIKNPKSFYQLRKHASLLLLKTILITPWAELYFTEFDLGRFKGFLAVDLSGGKSFIEIFTDQGHHQVDMYCMNHKDDKYIALA